VTDRNQSILSIITKYQLILSLMNWFWIKIEICIDRRINTFVNSI